MLKNKKWGQKSNLFLCRIKYYLYLCAVQTLSLRGTDVTFARYRHYHFYNVGRAYRLMDWKQLISNKRFGQEERHRLRHDDRSEFKRDYDRLIFSAPFRRMQNKTQVFPLPGSIFVHNRLTHSLEVASVGMSLGNDTARVILERRPDLAGTLFEEIGTIVSAACLATTGATHHLAIAARRRYKRSSARVQDKSYKASCRQSFGTTSYTLRATPTPSDCSHTASTDAARAVS